MDCVFDYQILPNQQAETCITCMFCISVIIYHLRYSIYKTYVQLESVIYQIMLYIMDSLNKTSPVISLLSFKYCSIALSIRSVQQYNMFLIKD